MYVCMYVCRGEERRGDVFDSEMGISLSYYMCFALLCFTLLEAAEISSSNLVYRTP